jgi:hypothetical protein
MQDKMGIKHKERKALALTVAEKDISPENVANPNKQELTTDGHKEVHQNKHQ